MAMRRNSMASIDFTTEQLAFFPFYLLFKTRSKSQRLTDQPRKASGFTLNWFLKDINGTQLTEKLPALKDDWRQKLPIPKYKQPIFTKIIQLAKYLRTEQNMTKEQILEKVLQEKMFNVSVLKADGICSSDRIKIDNLGEAFTKLVSPAPKADNLGSEEDVMTGFEIFNAIMYCPVKDIKLYLFVNQLLSNESSRSIIQTFVNIFRLGVIKDGRRKNLAKDFYKILATTLKLEYGNILLSTSTKSDVQAVIDNDWPFFTNSTDLVKYCLLSSNCEKIQQIIHGLGLYFCCFSFYIFYFSDYLGQVEKVFPKNWPSTQYI